MSERSAGPSASGSVQAAGRGGFVDVCAIADVPDAGAIRVMVGSVPVAVVRSEGTVYAIRDICSHAHVNLSEGEVEDATIECWLHGSRFDLASGKPLALPATRPVPVYPVAIDGDRVLVDVQAT